VTDQTTVLLYALSTLAQTCAALAAFVGAVGLYRLQILASRRRDVDEDLWTVFPRGSGYTRQQVLDSARASGMSTVEAWVKERDGVEVILWSSRRALIILEVWNLGVIGASIVGFNYVEHLSIWAGTFWALWVVALGTVGVTAWSVFAWTRE